MKKDVKINDFAHKTRVFYSKTLIFGLFLAGIAGFVGGMR